jgi:TonB family protein
MTTQTFDRYEAREEIGDGAMGRVFRGFDPLVRRPVAIKTVKSEYLTKDTREEYLRRFRREAQAAGRLSHSCIVSIFDVGSDYFVMEHVLGITLQDLLRYRGVLDLDEALRLLTPVADALDYAHRTGVIHRDIKPSNIMVQPDGRPKLMDFGVAHLETSAMTASGQFFGSPSYMAPEQILDGEVTYRADLFSFAVVAYEAVTGRRPFQGESITAIIYRVVNEPAPPPRSWNLDLPESFDEVFARALAKNPADRYSSAMAFVSALSGRDAEVCLASLVPEPIPEALVSALPAAEVETQEIDARHRSQAARLLRWAVPTAAVLALIAEITVLGRTRPPAREEPPLAAARAPLLRIETEPPGADVWLNGTRIGTSPVGLTELPSGPQQLRVESAGYAPAQLGFEVRPGTTPPPLRFVMSPVVEAAAPTRLDAPAGRSASIRPGDRLWTVMADAPTRAEPAPEPTPGLAEGSLVTLDDTVTPPLRIKGDDPLGLPPEARDMRYTGLVKLDWLVTENGVPADIRVLVSAGTVLDDFVKQKVAEWRYEPARKHGVRVRVRMPPRRFNFIEKRS